MSAEIAVATATIVMTPSRVRRELRLFMAASFEMGYSSAPGPKIVSALK
jgi:hypothetical protein